MSTAYADLTRTFTRLYRFRHLSSMAGWDHAAMMPPKGNDARSAALAELGVLMHNMLTDNALKSKLEQAAQENLQPLERANLREMRRSWDAANLLPASLVEKMTLANSKCEHAWRTQRPTNDWKGFAPNLKDVVRLAREQAKLLADAKGISRYDALMDMYEPGMTSKQIESIFGDVKSWLPDLIAKAQQRQASEQVITATGPFAVDKHRSDSP
jgi:carboxypeptidase Taq